MSVSFTVNGDPKGQPRPRAFAMKLGNGKYSARVFDSGTAEAWKQQIAVAASSVRPPLPFEGVVALRVGFVFRRPKSHFRANGELKDGAPQFHTSRPDGDNCGKCLLDVLTQIGGFWKDDCQVAQLTIWKNYGPTPGAVVEITEVLP